MSPLLHPSDAKAVVGVLCGLVALFGLGNLLASVCRTRIAAPLRRTKAYRRTVAFYRYVETSQPRAIGWCRFPTKGVILIAVLFYLFVVGTCGHLSFKDIAAWADPHGNSLDFCSNTIREFSHAALISLKVPH